MVWKQWRKRNLRKEERCSEKELKNKNENNVNRDSDVESKRSEEIGKEMEAECLIKSEKNRVIESSRKIVARIEEIAIEMLSN